MKFNPPTEDELAAKLRRQDDIKKEEEEFVIHGRSDQPKSELRSALADQLMEAANKNKPLKTAAYIYRPPPFEDDLEEVFKKVLKNGFHNLIT